MGVWWTIALAVGAVVFAFGVTMGALLGTLVWHVLTDPRGRAALARLLEPVPHVRPPPGRS